MSHGESCAGVAGAGVGVGGHKKLRRKRKELDALVPEDKVRRKSSSASHHDLLRSDSEDPEADYASVGVVSKRVMGGGGPGAGIWACLPGACTLLLLLTTLVGVAAALRLLMLTRRDLDSLHTRINSVEASSSELPAKFHESHVRLQELEKNQTALWAHVNDVSSSLAAANKRVEQLEKDVKTIQDSLSSAPQLSSLPKDVANLQGSVATFGSTLQDVQSSLKVVKQDHETLSGDMKTASDSIDSIKKEISVLHNQTVMGSGGRETGISGTETVGEAVVTLKQQVGSLTSAMSAVNTSLHSHVKEATSAMHKIESVGISSSDLNNVTQRLTTMEAWRDTIDSSLAPQVTNLSLTTAQLQARNDHYSQVLQNITQNVEVVKGVERKLEGSQVQLASGVSDLKQQIKKVDQKVNNLAEQSSTPPSQSNNETHSRKQRLTQADSGSIRNKRGP